MGGEFYPTPPVGKVCRLVLYADDSGSPGALLGYTEEIISPGTSPWIEGFLLSPVDISSGNDYWLGLHAPDTFNISVTGTASKDARADTYSDGPSDPWGTSSPSSSSALNIMAFDAVSISTLATGGSVMTGSDGTVYMVYVADDGHLCLKKYSGGGWETLGRWRAADVHAAGNSIAWVHAAIDSDDNIHIVSAATTEYDDRDVAYGKYVTGSDTAEYYFDASDSGPTDATGDWVDDAEAFDGITTNQYDNRAMVTEVTDVYASLKGTGTTAPTATFATISQVRVNHKVWKDQLMQFLTRYSGSTLNTDYPYGVFAWGGWETLTVPTGGWSWAKAGDLEVEAYNYAAFRQPNGYYWYGSKIEVTYSGVLAWETIANYTEQGPTHPGVAISIDSNDYPHVLFVDNIKQAGTARDNVYYIERTGGSWAGLAQVGTRVTKTHAHGNPSITLCAANDVEALYFWYTAGAIDPVAWRRKNAVWGAQDYAGDLPGYDSVGPVMITTGDAVYRYWVYAPADLYENTANTGIDPHSTYRRPSASLIGDSDRYVFYIDTSSDVHVHSNTGSGWTDEGAQQTGTYLRVIAEWAYNNEHQSGEINYLYDDGTYIYFDSFSLAEDVFPPLPGRVHYERSLPHLRM
jgi:hypothetical protein